MASPAATSTMLTMPSAPISSPASRPARSPLAVSSTSEQEKAILSTRFTLPSPASLASPPNQSTAHPERATSSTHWPTFRAPARNSATSPKPTSTKDSKKRSHGIWKRKKKATPLPLKVRRQRFHLVTFQAGSARAPYQFVSSIAFRAQKKVSMKDLFTLTETRIVEAEHDGERSRRFLMLCSTVIGYAARILRNRAPAEPSRPVPNRKSVFGSGVA